MYTAEIISKEVKDGTLSVAVKFTDEKGGSFNDVFTTNQKQKDDWINVQVERRIAHLEGVELLGTTIPLGRLDIKRQVEEQATLTERDEYAKKLRNFERFISATVRGFTTTETKEFKDLQKWLKDNFKTEFLDLFNG